MTLVALLQAAAPSAAPEGDVVVIARKLERWRATIRSSGQGTECITRRSSGDREIDAVGCAAMQQCWPDTRAQLKAAAAKGIAPADRKRIETDAAAAFGACAKPLRDRMIAELADRRFAIRNPQ